MIYWDKSNCIIFYLLKTVLWHLSPFLEKLCVMYKLYLLIEMYYGYLLNVKLNSVASLLSLSLYDICKDESGVFMVKTYLTFVPFSFVW